MIKSSKSFDGIEFVDENGTVNDDNPGYLKIQTNQGLTVVTVRDWLGNTVTRFQLRGEAWDELVR